MFTIKHFIENGDHFAYECDHYSVTHQVQPPGARYPYCTRITLNPKDNPWAIDLGPNELAYVENRSGKTIDNLRGPVEEHVGAFESGNVGTTVSRS